MLNFKLIIIAGFKLELIRKSLEEINDFYLGLLINDLRYETQKEGNRKKKEFEYLEKVIKNDL